MKNKKIAIVGSGISGLTCAYYLSKHHQVTVYEKDDYIGGHTHTVETDYKGEQANIDTGFIVFNDRTYPNFIQLMQEIGVGYQATEMSFSVKNDEINLEYNGNNLNSLFAQRSNLLRPSFWKMLLEITSFNKDVLEVADKNADLTIGEYLKQKGYSSLFTNNYLLPMISAIWSMGLESCLDFPLQFFTRFFKNHGLLDLYNRPQWYTILGGSSSYIAPLTESFKNNIRLNEPVLKVENRDAQLVVKTQQSEQSYDDVIFACHSDQIVNILSQPTAQQKTILNSFSFSKNRVTLHTDISVLPKRRKAWASWNYAMIDNATHQTTLTYNMNILQRLNAKNTYLVSLNMDIDPAFIIQDFQYDHPVYTPEMVKAQQQWDVISGKDNIHFCGAYWFNGFHEDGVRSGLRVCKMVEEKSCG